MINVNATLIVQAINFFIAYLLFRFILLKPAYQVITEENQNEAELQELVSRDKMALEEKKDEQLEQWRVCKQYCKDYIPELPDEASLFRGIAPKVTISSLSKHELDTMKDRITKTIISLVGVRGDR